MGTLTSYITWRVVKVAFVTALFMSLVILLIQIFRLGVIILGLPPSSSLAFLTLWFSYYTFFFLPDGLSVATALVVADLKEKKIIHIAYSMGVSARRFLSLFLVPFFLVFASIFVLSFFMFEEIVSFAKRSLILQYKERVIESVSERTFLKIGDLVMYVGEKSQGLFKNIFVRYKDTLITAERASYVGGGVLKFERGSLLTKEEGKYLLVEFDSYRLDIKGGDPPEIREKKLKRDVAVNTFNLLFTPIMFSASLWLSFTLSRTHTDAYYISGFLIVVHHILVFAVKAFSGA